MVYTDHYKEAAYIGRCRSVYQRTTGAVLSPLSAFLLLQGIETVALRIDRHVENGRAVAEFLRRDRRVGWVNYAGFAESPFHALAQKYLGGRACSLLTFGVKGGFEGGKQFYDALKLVKRLVNLGDAKSLACHPASARRQALRRVRVCSRLGSSVDRRHAAPPAHAAFAVERDTRGSAARLRVSCPHAVGRRGRRCLREATKEPVRLLAGPS